MVAKNKMLCSMQNANATWDIKLDCFSLETVHTAAKA